MKGKNSRALLLAGIAAVSVGAHEALAQEADEGEIVVTGIRRSLQSAAAQKRDAPQIIDAVTAEDIGKFPTENVADASQRITGVQITRTRGSGTGASIRGLPTDFTRVQLNGSTISSSIVDLRGGGAGGNISRSFDFRLLPTEFVSTLEVSKSPTSDMLEGGLSGTINVKTVRPLDLGRFTIVGSAFAAQNSNSGETTPRYSGLVSNTFMDGRLGVLFAGGFNQDNTETHNINNVGWQTLPEATSRVDYNGDGDQTDTFNIPTQVRTEIAREDRERTAFASVLEFRATDNLSLYAEGFYSKFDVVVESLENLFIFTGATGGVYDRSTTQFLTIPGIAPAQLAAGKPFATVLGLTGTDVRGNDRVNDSVSETTYYKAGGDYEGDQWTASLSVAYSNSELSGDNLNIAQIQRFQATEACLPGQEICGLSLSPESQARYLDPNQGIVASLNGAFGRETRDEITEIEGSISREFANSTRLSLGFASSQRETFANGQVLVVTAAQLAPLADLARSTVQATGFSVVPFTQVASAGAGSFLDAYDGSQPFPQQWLATDTLKLLAAIPRDRLVAAGSLQPNLNTVVDVEENITAFYARADFGGPDDRLSGNVGVRLVRTESTARGVAPDFNGIRVLLDAGGTTSVPPAGPVAAENSYTEFLPSMNVKYDVTDDFLVRFGASRTMSRPNLVQISPSTTITGGAGNFTITTGNPELEPFTALNFDLTAEWYPSPDTAVTLAVFAKELETLVRPNTDTVVLPVTFVTASTNTVEVRNQAFQRTRPTNESGVSLKGFEVGYQQVFTFLPGFLSNTGVQANYTFISNSDEDVLTAASKNNYNLSAFYETDRFGARVSYTWRDKFVSLGLPDGFNGLGVTTQARGVLDVSLTYNVTDHLSVVFEGTNVLDDVDWTQTTLGELPTDYFDPGHQLLLGARFRY